MPVLRAAGLLAIVSLVAIVIGMTVFARLSDHGARTIALSFMLLLGVAALIA